MKLSVFVSSSAAVLAVWLTVTYLSQVPADAYPKLGRGSVPQQTAQRPIEAAKPLVDLARDKAPVAAK